MNNQTMPVEYDPQYYHGIKELKKDHKTTEVNKLFQTVKELRERKITTQHRNHKLSSADDRWELHISGSTLLTYRYEKDSDGREFLHVMEVISVHDKLNRKINSSEGFSMLKKIYSTHKITAADEDDTFSNMVGVGEEDAEIGNQLDDMADNIEDIQDTVEDVREDSVDIEVDNNIANHYIAECEKCHNIFISAVVASDQDLNSVHGICPVCEEESDQDLKWVIREVDSDETEDIEEEQTQVTTEV